MNYKYVFLVVLIISFIYGCKYHSQNKNLCENDDKMGIIDSVINIPILEVQNIEIQNALNEIIEYKKNKTNILQRDIELFSVIETNYFNADIFIETIPEPSFLFHISGIPVGVILIEEFNFFCYDTVLFIDSLAKITDLFKCYNYVYNSNEVPIIQEFDTWKYSIKNNEILLDDFYPSKDEYKNLFIKDSL